MNASLHHFTGLRPQSLWSSSRSANHISSRTAKVRRTMAQVLLKCIHHRVFAIIEALVTRGKIARGCMPNGSFEA